LEEIVGQFTSNQNEIIWKYKLTTWKQQLVIRIVRLYTGSC
jgi:hypothetical protein